MATATDVRGIPIIDTDTHVVEPPDLWTSRLSSKWGDLVPHVALGRRWRRRRRGTSATSAARRGRGAGDGRMARAPAVPPAPLRRHRPGVVGRHAAGGGDGQLRHHAADPLSRTSPCSTPGASSTWATRSCSWRASRRTTTSSSTSAPSSRAGSSPSPALPFWDLDADPRRDRALRRHRPQGHRVHPGPGVLRPARARPTGYWDPMWRSAEEKGLPVNFHIASGDLDLFSVGHPDNGAARQLRGDGRVVLHGQRQDDRPAHHRRHLPPLPRPQLRVGRERHRLDPVRPRRARLAVAELRRRQRAPRVRPAAERVLPPPDLRLLLVRARHGAHGDRAARRRQRPVRDRLPAPDEHVARPGEHRRAPGRLPPRRCSPTCRRDDMRKILHDNAARIYHLD